jgi:hypothetical protein
MQDGHPVAFYSRKLTSAQRNYTVIEKELLSIVETLKEFHSLLYGCRELHVYTDHRNLTYNKLTSQRVLRWRVFIEDYAPIFHYIRGSDNVIADALSRLPLKEQGDAQHPSSDATPSPNSDNEFFSIARDAPEMFDCFVNLPEDDNVPFPLDLARMQQHQQNDPLLQEKRHLHPQRFPMQQFGSNVKLVCYVNPPNPWRIVIPSALLRPITGWHHKVLGHVGSSRLYESVSMTAMVNHRRIKRL